MDFASGAIAGAMTILALLVLVAGVSTRSERRDDEREEYRERARRDALAALRRAIQSFRNGQTASLERDLNAGERALRKAEEN